MIKQPFFLVGAERSGTTVLRLMLDCHPRIACFYEFEFSVDFVGDDGRFPDMDWMCEYLSRPLWRSTFPHGIPDRYSTYPEMMDAVLVEKRDRDGKDLIGGTVHRHFDRLLHIWPDAIFVHLLRDGRDVARSRIPMGWDGNVWTAIDTWLETEAAWDEMKGKLDPSRYHEVGYEELIADPVKELTRLCGFLGVAYSSDMLSYPESTTYSLPDPKLTYQWRTKATPLEVQLMEHKALPRLLERGYAASGLERVDISTARARKLERESKWRRRRFHMRRNGPMLYAADLVSRRLPLKSFRLWVEGRLNVVRLRHIK